MTVLDPQTENRLRQGFRRTLNPFMLLLWRLGLGGWFNVWPEVSGRVMVIVHTGRKTGRRRYAHVNYACVEGELYCVAGFGPATHWYRNLIAHPEVEVWTPDGWWAGVVEDISDSQRRPALMRQVLIGSGFAARVFGFDPIHMSDSALDAATAKYRLLHVHRAEARTGPGGPGDLAWVWPVATMLMLPLLLAGRRRRA